MATETTARDNLRAGEEQQITDNVTIVSGQVITRGMILGKITSGGKYKLADQLSSDGSEVANAIAIEDTDASAGDVTNTPILIKGEVNINAVSAGGTTTAISMKGALRTLGIHLKDSETV